MCLASSIPASLWHASLGASAEQVAGRRNLSRLNVWLRTSGYGCAAANSRPRERVHLCDVAAGTPGHRGGYGILQAWMSLSLLPWHWSPWWRSSAAHRGTAWSCPGVQGGICSASGSPHVEDGLSERHFPSRCETCPWEARPRHPALRVGGGRLFSKPISGVTAGNAVRVPG